MSKGTAGAASAAPTTPEEAEQLLGAITDPDDAARIVEISERRGQEWRKVKLLAERRWGQLLGPAVRGGDTSRASDRLSDATFQARRRARAVFAVPQEIFDEYLATNDNPTREGLFRTPGATPRKTRKSSPRRADAPLKGKAGLSHDPEVVEWVWRKLKAGWVREQMVEASHDEHSDWPRPKEPITNGGISEVRAAIAALDDAGVLGKPKQKSKQNTKRTYNVKQERAKARKQGDQSFFWDTCYEVTRTVGFLETIEVEHLALDEHGLDMVESLYEDLLRLQDWVDVTLGVIQLRLGEVKIYETIKKLRARTVENGCPAPEAEAAQRMADRMERRMRKIIAA